jgi:hypothetical protein
MGSKQRTAARTELFTLRLWEEVLSEGQTEWRGKIQYVRSGEARYFRDWSTMVKFLVDSLSSLKGARRPETDETSESGRLGPGRGQVRQSEAGP